MTKSSCQHGLVKSSTILLPEKPAGSISPSQSNEMPGKGVTNDLSQSYILGVPVLAQNPVNRLLHTLNVTPYVRKHF